MNTTVLKVATATGSVLGVISGLAAYNNLIPAKLLPYAAGLFAICAALHKVVDVVRDIADDGQLNSSAK